MDVGGLVNQCSSPAPDHSLGSVDIRDHMEPSIYDAGIKGRDLKLNGDTYVD